MPSFACLTSAALLLPCLLYSSHAFRLSPAHQSDGLKQEQTCGGGPECNGSCVADFESECAARKECAKSRPRWWKSCESDLSSVCPAVKFLAGRHEFPLPTDDSRCELNACEVLRDFTECKSLEDSSGVLAALRVPDEVTSGEVVKPWFKYVMWLDQSVSADGGNTMDGTLSLASADPEALAVVVPPTRDVQTQHQDRCLGATWTMWGGGNVSGTNTGPGFWKSVASKNCDLTFKWNKEHTEAVIAGYWYGLGLGKSLGWVVEQTIFTVTIELNKKWDSLFAAKTEQDLQAAINRWPECCEPDGASKSLDDVVRACNPKVKPECALYYRRNYPGGDFGPENRLTPVWPMQGYAVYPVARLEAGEGQAKWVALKSQYKAFQKSMQELKVDKIFWGK